MRHTKIVSLAGALCVVSFASLAATPGASASSAPSSAAKGATAPFRHFTHAATSSRSTHFVHASAAPGLIAQLARTPRLVGLGSASAGRIRPLTGSSAPTVSPAAPTLLNGFAGTAQGAAIGSFGDDQAIAPPDPNLAVGPSDVVEAANNTLYFFKRDGTAEGGLDLNSFVGHPCGPFLSDPRVVFDAATGRFYLTVLSYAYPSTNNCVVVLASPKASPRSGSWVGYTLRNSDTIPGQVPEADQPGLGFSDKVVAVTWTYFGSVDGFFYGSQVDIIQKSDLISGILAAKTVDSFIRGPFAPQPVVSIGSTGANQFVVANDADSTCTPDANKIAVFDFIGQPEKSNVSGHLTLSTVATPTTGCSTGTKPAPQAGTAATLSTDDDRLLNAVWSGNVIWTGGNTNCIPSGDATNRSCLNIDSIGATTAGVVTTTANQWIVGVNAEYLYYPAVSVDATGNAIFVFDESTSTSDEAVMVAAITGGVPSSFTTLHTSSTFYDPGGGFCSGAPDNCRWGDYSGAAQDPSHPNDVWVVSEDTDGNNGSNCQSSSQFCWNTTVGRYTYPQTPSISGLAAPTGPISGGRTLTVNGSDFLPGTTATFGGNPITISNLTPDSFQVVTPSGTVGSLPAVQATDSEGTSASTPADQYIYAPSFSASGKSDLAAVNSNSAFVTTSNGSAFGTPAGWASGAFFGTVATMVGDVNGDGMTDLLAINSNSVWVELSTGSSFAAPVKWSSTAFSGSKALLLADVSGDGRADLVAVNNNSVWVMQSTGGGFSAPAPWSTNTPFFGGISTVAGDVTGTGRAALVAINSASTYVMTSTGTTFNLPTQWSATPFSGSRATMVGDVSGEGRADLIALDDTSVFVMTSTGTAFSAPSQWSSVPFFGSRATLLGDLHGDGHEDLIAVDDSSTWVLTSTATHFVNPPARWSTTPFYGGLATFSGG